MEEDAGSEEKEDDVGSGVEEKSSPTLLSHQRSVMKN